MLTLSQFVQPLVNGYLTAWVGMKARLLAVLFLFADPALAGELSSGDRQPND